jgi:hypothetical protein
MIAEGVEAKREAEINCLTEPEIVLEIYMAMAGTCVEGFVRRRGFSPMNLGGTMPCRSLIASNSQPKTQKKKRTRAMRTTNHIPTGHE